jgi:hypothetical protein
MIGCTGLIFILTSYAFFTCFCNLWLSGSAFYSITFRLSLRHPFRFAFPDGAFFRPRLLQFLSMSSQTLWNFRFSPFCIPENFSDFHLLHLPLVNPTIKRSLFSRLTEQYELIHHSASNAFAARTRQSG